MENIVKELKQNLTFKDTTDIGDIILIAATDPQMIMYASVTGIERDTTRKDEWWTVHFIMLSIPLQKMSWTLRTEQMTGKEIFTMGGKDRFVQAVDLTLGHSETPKPEKKTQQKKISPLKRVK